MFIYHSWQATSFERPPSWVAFIEGFHCTCIIFYHTVQRSVSNWHTSWWKTGSCWFFIINTKSFANYCVFTSRYIIVLFLSFWEGFFCGGVLFFCGGCCLFVFCCSINWLWWFIFMFFFFIFQIDFGRSWIISYIRIMQRLSLFDSFKTLELQFSGGEVLMVGPT